MKKLIPLLACAALFTCCNTVGAEPEKTLSNKQKAIAVLESIESGDPAPIAYINPKKYTQHNLAVGDGLAGFGEVMKQLPKGSAKAKVVRAFEDGDFVFTHTDYNFFGPKVGFDIFRFEDGLIVEHWDNLQAIAEENPSGRTQLDGPTEVKDLEKTSANKAMVKKFVDEVLIGGDMAKLTDYINPVYMQHNPGVGDGLEALGKAMAAMAKAGIPMSYEKNHAVLAEGNFALVVSEGKFKGKHSSFYDLFRIEDGKIIEHWDTIETIPPRSEWKHDNGKFGIIQAAVEEKQHGVVIEIATFKLLPGVIIEDFAKLDKAVETQHVSKQPGFISRQSGYTKDGQWMAIVHWLTEDYAKASMASFSDAPATAPFMSKVDADTMKMTWYTGN